eukprot:g725.t1
MTQEGRSFGGVATAVYCRYVQALGGTGAALCVLAGFALGQVGTLASRWWLSFWSEHATGSGHGHAYYLNIYVLFALAQSACLLVQFCTCMHYGFVSACSLFDGMLARVLRAPMSFFDTTPMGRVVNRFSKDVYCIDEQLPNTWNSYLSCFSRVLGVIVAVTVVTPTFAAALLPIFALYIYAQRFFIRTSRELKRLDSVSRSPLYAHFSETLDGITTLRAFGLQPQCAAASDSRLDRNQRAYFLTFTANCWLAVRLELAGTLIVFFAALCAVLQHPSTDPYFPGLAGLSISFALGVTQALNWSVRMASDRETQMVSVERVHEYANGLRIERVVPGGEAHGADADADMGMGMGKGTGTGANDSAGTSWLSEGSIELRGVSLRYRPELEPVLRGLSFSVRAGEKLGVVGRTGAGKSSLILALLRLVEIDKGTVRIGGHDIAALHLDALRGALSIIPQEPVLFSGTVRENLDPFHRHADAGLCRALERVHLLAHAEALAVGGAQGGGGQGPLGAAVAEGGANFSLGQRQLLCIARAMLQRSHVVLLDEATSSVDAETDALIQQRMRSDFAASTVITVAHRINTIIDSDRVLVMERGRVAELAPPRELLADPRSLFHALVHEHEQA